MGGKGCAQGLAALQVLFAPGLLAGDNLLTMNAFEPLFWLACAYLLVRIIKTGNQKLWIPFGMLAGIGIENKYSILIFAAGLILGLRTTRQGPPLPTHWPWTLAVGGPP